MCCGGLSGSSEELGPISTAGDLAEGQSDPFHGLHPSNQQSDQILHAPAAVSMARVSAPVAPKQVSHAAKPPPRRGSNDIDKRPRIRAMLTSALKLHSVMDPDGLALQLEEALFVVGAADNELYRSKTLSLLTLLKKKSSVTIT